MKELYSSVIILFQFEFLFALENELGSEGREDWDGFGVMRENQEGRIFCLSLPDWVQVITGCILEFEEGNGRDEYREGKVVVTAGDLRGMESREWTICVWVMEGTTCEFNPCKIEKS